MSTENVGSGGFFPERLRNVRRRFKQSQQEMADLLGVNRSYYSQIEGGKVAPGPRLREKIVEILDTAEQEGQLFSVNKGTMVTFFHPSNAKLLYQSEISSRGVPVVSWAAAGKAGNFEDLCNQIDELVPTNSTDPNCFSVRVEGDSMEPRFKPGDSLIINPNSEPRNGNLVIAKTKSGDVYFKLFHRVGPQGEMARLTSYNPLYPPFEVPLVEFEWIYPVHSFIGKL